MTNDTSATDHQPSGGEPRPSFTPPGEPPAQAGTPAYGTPPAGYGAQPVQPVQPVQPEPQPQPGQPGEPVEHEWTPDGLVAKPALPAERVGRGAALALLAIPAGAIVSGIIAELGYIATLSSIVTAALAAILYARGSGGRVKKGIPLIALTIAVGLVVSFFASIAVQLWKAFPTLEPDVSAGYTRGGFVATNLFYPPVVGEAAKEATLFIILGVVVGFATIVRLARVTSRA